MKANPYRYEIERNELLKSLSLALEDLDLSEAELYEWAATEGLGGVGRGFVAALKRKLSDIPGTAGHARDVVRRLGHWFRKEGDVRQDTIDGWYDDGGLMRVADGVHETHKRVVKRIRIRQDEEIEALLDALGPLLSRADIPLEDVKDAYKARELRGVIELLKQCVG